MSDFEDSLSPREGGIEHSYEKWARDETYYGTGSTTPPKDHGATVALVLAMVILLCSMLTSLSLMNVQVFHQTELPQETVGIPVRFSAVQGEISQGLEEVEATLPGYEIPLETVGSGPDAKVQVETTPAGEPNVAEQDGAKSWQQVYEEVIDSVVSISCTLGNTSSSGTGVVMDKRGYLITNAHVVEDAQWISVLLNDGRTFDAVCIGMDTVSDLAVLYIEANDLHPAQFGDSASLRVGDEVVAIGDPLGVQLRGTMTDGIISGINRDIQVSGRSMTLLQTTAALNSGNSGGPLVNCYGQVIGINTVKIGDYAANGGVEGLGFAIPTTTVKSVVEQLVTNGYVAGRPSLGLSGEMVSNFYQYYYRLPGGLLISSVEADSDAALKGLQAGDILMYLEDVRITSLETLEQTVYSYQVGDTVSAVIYRGGKEYQVDLVLGEDKGK